MDLEHRGNRPGGMLLPFGTVVAGLSHLVLAASAGRVALAGTPSPRDDVQARGVASTLLDQPFGPYLLAVVAAGLFAHGLSSSW